jgi:hypothetical protein
MQENCGKLILLLQQIPGCEKMNDDLQEWMEKD